jgi:hypothetical protein
MMPYYIPEWNNPDSAYIRKRETELRVDFLRSGGQLYVFGADEPDRVRGPNPYGVVLDEYSVQKKEIWTEVIQPIMRANPKAWCWFLATPRGKNHFWEVYQYGLDQNRQDEWKSWELKAVDSNIFTPQQLENARRDMDEKTFNQELMCEFLEGEGSVFRNVTAIMTAQPKKSLAGHFYVMGIDLAKVQDYTVTAVYDRKTNEQVYQDRFKGMEWPFVKQRIKSVADHYNQALISIDATGLGDPIVDDLIRSGLGIEPIKFTSESKKEIIEKLSVWIDSGRIKMLPLEETRQEFEAFSYEMTDQGRIKYQAREGFHDDIVFAHALAIWQLDRKVVYNTPKEKPLIRQWYENIIQDKYKDTTEYEDPQWDDWSSGGV